MSLKRNVDEMITEKLPQKGRINKGIVYSGLHKRPQMEQIVDYLVNGQERTNFPDREAKQVRNHPFMTQLDFFDMQEEQQKAWADTVRKKEAQEVAEKEKTSEALEVARNPNNKSVEAMIDTTEDLDQSYRDADFIIDYKDELKTNLTRIRGKRESNAQTNAWGLAYQAKNPTYDGPSPSAPTQADLDEEEEEEEGRPGSSAGPRRAKERRGQTKVGPDGERLQGQSTLDGFGRTLDSIEANWKLGVFPKAALMGTKLALGGTKLVVKAASFSGTKALDLYDYATDADGSRQQARIDREIEEEAARLRKETSILASLDEQGNRRAAQWDAHVDKHAITPHTARDVTLNENDPVHTKKVWNNLGTMGLNTLQAGEKYMLSMPGNALLAEAGPVRGNKKGKKKK